MTLPPTVGIRAMSPRSRPPAAIPKVAPYFIDVDPSADPAALPVGGLTIIAFPNNHCSMR